jgi:6-phosphogluconate dehydrogenase
MLDFCAEQSLCLLLSTVPGGSDAAWPEIKEIFQKTAAQTDGERECGRTEEK